MNRRGNARHETKKKGVEDHSEDRGALGVGVKKSLGFYRYGGSHMQAWKPCSDVVAHRFKHHFGEMASR